METDLELELALVGVGPLLVAVLCLHEIVLNLGLGHLGHSVLDALVKPRPRRPDERLGRPPGSCLIRIIG